MASKSKIAKSLKYKRKNHSTRGVNRCQLCGRPKAYIRIFGLCRICFRELAVKGVLPGVKKASK